MFFAETTKWILIKTIDISLCWQDPSFLLNISSLITYNDPLAMDPKNGGHDGKRWFIGINSSLTGLVIISSKNWNIPIKWKVVIAF